MKLVLVNDEIETLDLARALGEISPERRAVACKYRFERDQRLSVAVYLLLKEALRQQYGLRENPRLALGPTGKPYLPDYPAIHFNFSHCPKAAACVVADHPVGIDVEALAPVREEVARTALSADEWRAVRAAADPAVAFARFWTQKEAVAKLSGRGLDDERLKTLLADLSGVSLETVVRPEKGYVLTTAIEI